ncbi:MAG TPA: glycosyltransferase [Terriglobales bacterium]|nr:glycosyltransferase [Terriglobales bacterium]
MFFPLLAGGGLERVMLNLARGLALKGTRVDLVLACAQGPYLQAVPPGVNLVDFRSLRVSRSILRLASYLRHRRPDAVISASTHANVATICARAIARGATRVIVTEHNPPTTVAEYNQDWRTWLLHRTMKSAYRFADSVVAVSRGLADDMARRLQFDRDSINVIYNPVVTPALLANAAEPLDHPWFGPGQPPVVLAVGRLEPRKDFSTLLRAFTRLRRARPARIMILGEGPDRPRLESIVRELRIEENAALPGFVDNPYKYMKRAKVLVLSSRSEGLPTVLIEAMALGTQVVSTDCLSGPDEILEWGKWGKLVPVGDDLQMASAICDILDGRARYNVEDRASAFSLDNIVDSYLDVVLAGS